MVTYMNDKKIRSVEDVRAFLAGSTEMEFSITDKDERYRWIEQTLRRFNYRTLRRAERGVVLRYLERVSGYSRQTLTRLVAQYQEMQVKELYGEYKNPDTSWESIFRELGLEQFDYEPDEPSFNQN